ncbi:MAG: hypothetical protein IKJ77_07565 [Firmicutes bacterium]|nr:hypothetical protein [Bacillota bacterium]
MGKARHKKTTGVNIPMCVACVLFCLTLISIHMTSGFYAKYTVGAEGNDGARVAIMATDAEINLEDFCLAPGEEKEFTVTLTNQENERVCEVAQSYTLKVENLTNNLDFAYEYYLMDTGTMTIVDEATGIFEAGTAETATYKVKVLWPDVPQPANHAFEMDALRIVVHAEQID